MTCQACVSSKAVASVVVSSVLVVDASFAGPGVGAGGSPGSSDARAGLLAASVVASPVAAFVVAFAVAAAVASSAAVVDEVAAVVGDAWAVHVVNVQGIPPFGIGHLVPERQRRRGFSSA